MPSVVTAPAPARIITKVKKKSKSIERPAPQRSLVGVKRSQPQLRVNAKAAPAVARTAVRYAVVGLGHIAQVAVLPGMQQARYAKITALVSSDDEKMRILQKRYQAEAVYTYDAYDDLLASGTIDAVYIALPNALHCDYALRALRAGIHVLTEKPMAVTSAECRRMISAAERYSAKLMIAYRLHFNQSHLQALSLSRSGKLGELRYFNSIFSMQVQANNVRTESHQDGGGPLYDLGVYCINAARAFFKSEPYQVMACTISGTDERFSESEEMVSVVMRFPDFRVATFTASFGAANEAMYEIVGTHGSVRMDPGYEYVEKIHQRLKIDGKKSEKIYPVTDQFAGQIEYFSRCVLDDTTPEPAGKEGLADIRIVEAIIKSAKTQRWVRLDEFEFDVRYPRPKNMRSYAPAPKVSVIHAKKPHK